MLGGMLGLVNVTGDNARGIVIPASEENGWQAGYLGNDTNLEGETTSMEDLKAGNRVHDGFPRSLYPSASELDVKDVVERGGLVMGPLQVNESFFMMSFTSPIINNTEKSDLLGFLTVVVNAQLVFDVVRDIRGLGHTGQVILVGPPTKYNLYSKQDIAVMKEDAQDPWNSTLQVKNLKYKYLFPPALNPELGGQIKSWEYYPSVWKAYIEGIDVPNPKLPRPYDQTGYSMLDISDERLISAGRMEVTTNAQGTKISSGYVPAINIFKYLDLLIMWCS